MDTPTLEQLTRIFVKIRDKKAQLAADFKVADDDLARQMETLKTVMLDYLKEQNVESVRTSAGLVYRSVKTRYWTGDWQAMHAFIVDNNLPQLLEKRLNQTAVRELLESDPELQPPGLNTDSEYVVTVRKT